MDFLYEISSPLGEISVSSDGERIIGLWFKGQNFFRRTLASEVKVQDLPIFNTLRKWLAIYFRGDTPPFDLPLAPRGSSFQRSVWHILTTIPHGAITSYGEIAAMISADTGKNMAAQPVGGAIAHNPISILIPCHRVVGADGGLTGYAGGIDKKGYLLTLEKHIIVLQGDKYKISEYGTRATHKFFRDNRPAKP
jgi:methylated-DNA-[protein]-cysteine S-methyltransferase